MACSLTCMPNLLKTSHVLSCFKRHLYRKCCNISFSTSMLNRDTISACLHIRQPNQQTYSYIKSIVRQLHQDGQNFNDGEYHYKDLDSKFKNCEETQKMLEEIRNAFGSDSVKESVHSEAPVEKENVRGKTDVKDSVAETSQSFKSVEIESTSIDDLTDGEVEDETSQWTPPIPLTRGETGVYSIEDLVKLLEDENAVDICVIRVPKLLNYVDYLVIVSGISLRHMRAIAEDVKWAYKRRANRRDPSLMVEGADSREWIALDLGNIALHIFEPDTREKYDLETLWTVGAQYDEKSQQKVTINFCDIKSFMTTCSAEGNTTTLDFETHPFDLCIVP